MKSIAGVVESGIFTPRPVEVYVIQRNGGYRVLTKDYGASEPSAGQTIVQELQFRWNKFITGWRRAAPDIRNGS